MIRVNWFQHSKKITKHFGDNVFKPGHGPDFEKWLLEETGGRIGNFSGMPTFIEFADERDYTVFLLKWSGQ